MSDTKRKILKGDYNTKIFTFGGDRQVDRNLLGKRKMKPYTLNFGFPKMKPTGGREYVHSGEVKHVSSYDKLTTKNANRSQKKGVRQLIRKEIKESLLNYKNNV